MESVVARRAAAAATAQEASSIVLESQQILTKEGMVHLPKTFRATGQQFDLVVHFHGPPHALGAANLLHNPSLEQPGAAPGAPE